MPALSEKDGQKTGVEKKETFAEGIAGYAAVFVVGLFIITFILQHFEIPSGSMEDTLLVGDHVFVDRFTRMQGPEFLRWILPYRKLQRGDIAVFPSPAEPGLYLVKRIVGVPGDRIHLENGTLYLNGVAQKEPYVLQDDRFNPYSDNFPSISGTEMPDVSPGWPETVRKNLQGGDLVVPPHFYFAMGDHRSVSLDSRYWGFVPEQNIVGEPLFIAWSLKKTDRDYQPESIPDRISSFLHTTLHFFGETRWNRVFRLVR